MNPMIQTDSYKLSHKGFMNEGTEFIYSNMTARSSKHFPIPQKDFDGNVVVYGIQHTVEEFLVKEMQEKFFDIPKEEAIEYLGSLFDAYLGKGSVSTDHFEELHDLGYLPIEVKALPEGSLVPIKVPLYTIQNTHPRFGWLTNYLETVMSCETWKAPTIATLIYNYRKLVNEWAMKTTGSTAGTEFQLHDFSMRGMSNRQDAAKSGSAFLLSSNGTDNVPAIQFVSDFYKDSWKDTFIGTSVPAREHSLASTGTAVEGELETIRRWVTQDYPKGVVSVISDTFDFWKVVTMYAEELRSEILAREVNEIGLAKVVFRPDSGNPADILCGTAEIEEVPSEASLEDWAEGLLSEVATAGQEHGEPGDCQVEVFLRQDGITYKATGEPFWNRFDKRYYYYDGMENIKIVGHELTPAEKGAVECLWEVFGGTVSAEGYRVLHERVGLIYGDSMTYPLIKEICQRLAAKNFASVNVVFGIGSYTMQYLTRDSLGIAVKATAATVDGVEYQLYKDPVTDDGVKKSAKGLLRVDYDEDGVISLFDQQTAEQEKQGLLETVLVNGEVKRSHSFTEIRQRLWS